MANQVARLLVTSITLSCLIVANFAIAQQPALLSRSGPLDGFLMPGNSGFANNLVSLNDSGRASIRVTSLRTTGERGIWTGDGVSGQIVATINPASSSPT